MAEFNESEIRRLCEIILESTGPADGFVPPYMENERLVIPFRAPLKYRSWAGGQSILETLTEIGAADEIKAKYTPTGFREGMEKPGC